MLGKLQKGLCVLSVLLPCMSAHAGKVTYVYTDPQGTPLAEADASGNIIATMDYRPYGAQAMGSEPNGPGYTGHVNDPDSGLVYMQARYYDPLLARFLSVDPMAPTGGDIFSMNRFSYVENNPVMNIDPTGACVGSHHEPGDPCNPEPMTGPPPPPPPVSPAVQRMRDASDRLSGPTSLSTMPRTSETPYWGRVKENFVDANVAIPGIAAPPFFGAITGRAVSNATTLPTMMDALVGSYRMGYLTLEIAPAVAHSAINFVAVGSAFEAGLFIGSTINAAKVPGSGVTYRQWYGDYFCDISKNCR